MAKIAFVAHWDWPLYNFRLPLAKTLQKTGHEVIFICPSGSYTKKIEAAGFRWVSWQLNRGSLNPFLEIRAIRHLGMIYLKETPDVVHHFTIKPNVYGPLASVTLTRSKEKSSGKRPVIINTFEGLGSLFSRGFQPWLLRRGVLPLLRLGTKLAKPWTIFLNLADKETLLRLRVISGSHSTVIPGIGVDTKAFCPNGNRGAATQVVVLMACRLIWDKGVKEYVEAATRLKGKGAEFWLAGSPDPGNPACVPERLLKKWHETGVIRWLGHRDDMPNLFHQADIAVLPTYYNEGVPRFLLEAAASGLPLVATDLEGCRVVVRENYNGLLVPAKNPAALADAIARLLQNTDMKRAMGRAGRQRVLAEFAEDIILKQYMEFYEKAGISA